jgi:hypothetical protein
MTATPPTLDAYREHGRLHVWCEHCRIFHKHGPGDGHPHARCPCEGSPYHAGGYVLQEVGPFTSAVRAPHRVHEREALPPLPAHRPAVRLQGARALMTTAGPTVPGHEMPACGRVCASRAPVTRGEG